jgi:methionine aminopeptidase
MHELKNGTEIEYIRQSCRIVAELLEYLREIVKNGVTTEWLDQEAEEFIEKRGATPAFKNYNGFPASICSSINEEVIHGIPGEYRPDISVMQPLPSLSDRSQMERENFWRRLSVPSMRE